MRLIGKHHIVFEELTYDIEALTDLYFKMRHCALEWNEYKYALKGDTHKRQKLLDDVPARLLAVYSPMYEGREMTEYPEVQEVISKFNFLTAPSNNDVSFQINEPNFNFKTHLDRHLEYTIMLPLLPRENFAPLTFWEGSDRDRNTTTKKIYTLDYSMKHPTVFDGKVLHSTEKIDTERVIFRIKVAGETYNDMLARYKSGTFLT
jgi:hypothetical protein